jgi:glycerol-3-phosphate dehydrogenase (NAD+)
MLIFKQCLMTSPHSSTKRVNLSIGSTHPSNAKVMKDLFNYPTFRCAVVNDPVGVELCGALKNVVAIGAGFCDGLSYGMNTKAAIIRIGLVEMYRFCKKFYSGVNQATFFESCGVADLITTCMAGRNRKCAEAFVKTKKSWEQLESELLGGQKLQGTLTAAEVYKVLAAKGCLEEFPFFTRVYEIAYAGKDPTTITLLPEGC